MNATNSKNPIHPAKDTLQDEKARLRRAARARVWPDAAAQDQRIAARALSLPAYRQAKTVCCFVSTPREIDTRPILLDALSGGKRLCVPLCLGAGAMEMRAVRSLAALSPGTWGILEPGPDAPCVPPEDIGLVLVPCLACDRRGYRLGQGGGYYDRWLSRYHGPTVALCREAALLDAVPRAPWDVPVSLVITERGCYGDGGAFL